MGSTIIKSDTENADDEMNSLLSAIVQNNEKHYSWLNTLSFLEYMGSRKIFRTQDKAVLSEKILKHASDESRHALYLKQLACKLGRSECEDYTRENMLSGFSAYRYFQSLDIEVKKEFAGLPKHKSYHICYVYVSYIIEIRANWMYDLYAKALQANNSPVSVGPIIGDEKRHLEEMKEELYEVDGDADKRLPRLLSLEKKLFNRFYQNLKKAAC